MEPGVQKNRSDGVFRAMNKCEDVGAYMEQWYRRKVDVDCPECAGDLQGDEAPGSCCTWTGLDPIPWSELFKDGRARKKSRRAHHE